MRHSVRQMTQLYRCFRQQVAGETWTRITRHSAAAELHGGCIEPIQQAPGLFEERGLLGIIVAVSLPSIISFPPGELASLFDTSMAHRHLRMQHTGSLTPWLVQALCCAQYEAE